MFELVQTQHAAPPRMVIHGGEKVGKSTFCSQVPGVVFLPTEEGLRGLNAQALLDTSQNKKRYETFEELDQALQWCENPQNHDKYKAICLDSADWTERLIHEKILREDGAASMGAACGGYGKGYEVALGYWRNLLTRLDRLNSQGKWIILICHSVAVTHNDPMHDDYDTWEMKLHVSNKGQGALPLLKEWADIIAFASREKFVSKQSGSEKVRANETDNRILHLEGSAAFMAGNRYGLPKQVNLDWQSFRSALFPE